MAKKLFRDQSLERLSSPDALDHYIKVVNPSTFLILATVSVFLLTLLIWSIFGRVDTKITVPVYAQSGQCVARISDGSQLELGMSVEQNGEKYGTIVLLQEEAEETLLFIEGEALADGMYVMDVVVEQLHPIYFLLS